ncbi:hypothetical protein HYALB_00005804 [Hymenoscyphus albidus]|uniref:Alpha-ketoglutarate-dependent dioxygenase AlkB-like domain-containing protein n=1 Tax=Hymenoscyphus albidus TaxID=595503 RepID=A0A9N9LKE4_9HELO|nr:hypothetical protein HYALB_00005804 [Hymenoscyphus albidus]
MDPNKPPVKKQKLNELGFIGQPATEESPVPDTTPRKRRSGTAQVDYTEPPTSPTSAPVEKSTDSSFEVSSEPVKQAGPRKSAPQKKGPASSAKKSASKRKAVEAPSPQNTTLEQYFTKKVDDVVVAVDNKPMDYEDFKEVKQQKAIQAEDQDEEIDDTKLGKVVKAYLLSREYLSKPAPVGQPEAWAHVRQALCDTYKAFQALQGGTYRTAGKACGLLVNTMVGDRDYFDEDVIITTCGGGRSKVGDKMIQNSDQKPDDNFAKCWMASMESNTAVIVIAGKLSLNSSPFNFINNLLGQCNKISPCKLPYAFNVLGWYQITNVWTELRNKFKTWCVRLERVNLEQQPWYMPEGNDYKPKPYTTISSSQTCTDVLGEKGCGQTYEAIFSIGWLCLNPSCKRFFKHPNYNGDGTLTYASDFLEKRTPFTGEDPGPVVPPLPESEDLIQSSSWGTEKAYLKGIVCPRCRCCSRRLEWAEWACENPRCDFTYRLNQPVIPAALAISDTTIGDPANLRYHVDDQVIKSKPMTLGPNYIYYAYELPFPIDGGGYGRVYHIKSNGNINKAADGPNQMFEEMQSEDFGLKRNPVRNAGKDIEVVTRHYSANYGAPYKFGVLQGTSKPFSEAPPTTLKALKRVQWMCEELFKKEGNVEDHKSSPSQLKEFNEVLNVGYFETCRMGYHDDGESTLGPTVASLSFGASATMSFRPKNKSKIPGCKSSGKSHKGDILRIILQHGDIMVMDGSDVQVHYEHKVESHGRLRYAMTCRHIKIDTIEYDPKVLKGLPKKEARAKANELRETAAKAALMPEGHERFDYDGNEVVPEPEEAQDSKAYIKHCLDKIKARVTAGDISKETAIALVNEFMESL